MQWRKAEQVSSTTRLNTRVSLRFLLEVQRWRLVEGSSQFQLASLSASSLTYAWVARLEDAVHHLANSILATVAALSLILLRQQVCLTTRLGSRYGRQLTSWARTLVTLIAEHSRALRHAAIFIDDQRNVTEATIGVRLVELQHAYEWHLLHDLFVCFQTLILLILAQLLAERQNIFLTLVVSLAT